MMYENVNLVCNNPKQITLNKLEDSILDVIKDILLLSIKIFYYALLLAYVFTKL